MRTRPRARRHSHRSRTLRAFAVLAAATLLVLLGSRLPAQESDPCEESGRRGERERACEVREWSVAATGDRIRVDASPNGGITVEGWDRDGIAIRAVVRSRADDRERAREILDEVEVRIDGTEIDSRGPDRDGDESWSVSYRLRVPARSDLSLESTNGGIDIRGVSGEMSFRTTNGGIDLAGIAGDVRGRTTNGSVDIRLGGDVWDGAGLDVETTNGGIDIVVPEGYSAKLETGTTNGSVDIAFPITVQGRLGRRLTTTLGDGGPRIRAITTNGKVDILRR